MLKAVFRHPGPICATRAAVLAAGILALTAVGEPVWAAGVIIESHGFESPFFSPGSVVGQSGWKVSPASTGTAVVQSSVVDAPGSQALQINHAASSIDVWTANFPATPSRFPTQRYVAIDWDMLVMPSSLPAGNFGPFFGVEAYDYLNSAGNISSSGNGVGTLGSLWVDAKDGEVLYQAANTGIPTSTGTVVSLGVWNQFRMVLDYSTHQYAVFLNGNLLGLPVGFVDQNNTVGGLEDITHPDIAARAGGLQQAELTATGTAFFDNFLVRDGLLGDYDLSGIVDSADYAVWKQAFGNIVSPAGNNADGNGNGKVDAADYTVWRDHLGASLFSGAGSGSFSGNVAPEPNAIVLALFGLCPFAFHILKRIGLKKC
jgi:hypothetical protein